MQTVLDLLHALESGCHGVMILTSFHKGVKLWTYFRVVLPNSGSSQERYDTTFFAGWCFVFVFQDFEIEIFIFWA